MKSNAIARIVLYSLLIVILLGILVTVTCFDLFTFNTDSGQVVVGEEVSLDAADISGLSIDWAAGTITIQTADTDQITFSESGATERYRMVYNVQGGTLEIQYSKSSASVGVNNAPSKDLTITVPQDWVCDDLEFDAAAVELNVDGLTVGTLELDGAAAELHFHGSVEQMDIDGAAVEMEITATNCPYSIDIDGASCELALYLSEECGFLVQMDGLSSSFDSDLDYTTRAGEYRYGNEACVIDVEGLSCSVTINQAPIAE